MATTDNPNSFPQTNDNSDQDYDVDIKQLFQHFIAGGTTKTNEANQNVGIDDIRAQISPGVLTSNTATLLKSLNIDPTSNTPGSTPNNTNPTLLVQESRCHAFYRILGLPVVSADGSQFYNPGFDIIKNPNRKLNANNKITIAGQVGSNFEKISAERETWSAKTAQIFSNSTSIEAGVLSLTSGTYGNNGAVNKRTFNLLNNVSGPMDFNSDHQSYAIATSDCIVGNTAQPLSSFQDADGNTINNYYFGASKTPSPIFFRHQHIIAPFMVDPRIDYSIWANESITFPGISRRIAVPFVPDATYLQVSSTATAERPIIESIITQRVYQNNQQSVSGSSINIALDLIKNDPNIGQIFIGSTSISNIFSGNIFNLSQKSALADTISTIETMVDKLIQALQTVQAVQGIYYFLPSPNTMGPEGGCNIRPVPINKLFSKNLITTNDLDIIINQLQVLFSQPLGGTSSANSIPDIAQSAFSTPIMSFNKNTTDAQGSLSSQTMNTLANKRKQILNDAINSLQIIEMIMGEFSGLGLCDIIAIVGALYTMKIDDLVGLLDIDAYARAQTNLKASLPQNSSIVDSMNSLLQNVSGFYQLMDQIYLDKLYNSQGA